MRAVSLDAAGLPVVGEVDEPEGDGELVRVLACGLCGSDVEKLRPEFAGIVLGHEVVAETADGRRVALVHHRGCGECERCRGGHESTCAEFARATIRPGGFAERVRADAWIDVPGGIDDARATALEPLACVVRGSEAVPAGRVLVLGQGFVGRLFAAVLARRGDDVFAVDADPRRSGRAPDGPVDAVVVCAPGAGAAALEPVRPGGTILVFADAGAIPAAPGYRRELTLVGSRSATPATMREAVRLLPGLELPEPTVLPLERFAEGLDLYRRREALKVVFVP
jgi:L-iditol 2-dehydrogenase